MGTPGNRGFCCPCLTVARTGTAQKVAWVTSGRKKFPWKVVLSVLREWVGDWIRALMLTRAKAFQSV